MIRKRPKEPRVANLENIFKDIIHKARAIQLSLFCLPLFCSHFTFCYPENFNSQLESAYFDVLNLDFKNARNKLKSTNQDLRKNPYRVYVLNLADALEVFISDNQDLYNKYSAMEDLRLQQVAMLPASMPEKLFLEADIRIHWAFVKLRFGHYFKAFFDFRKAYFSITENIDTFPNHLPSKKSIGVLHTIIGSFPENFNWLLSLMGLDGDIDKGISELNLVNSSNSVFSNETKAYISIFQTFLLNQKEKAVKNLENINGKDDYVAIKLISAFSLIKNSESKKAEAILLKMLSDGVGEKIPFLYYLTGEIYLQENRYSESISLYKKFISGYQGQNYIKDAYTKLAINYWLMNNESYKYYLKKAANSGLANIDADKNAAQLIENNQLPNKVLLKIRYATDGGFYEKAEKCISQSSPQDFNDENEILEFHYRKARLYHKTEKIEAAIHEYKKVIELQKDGSLYFAPNSNLQMGYIYSVQKDYERALKYFETAKKYKSHPYKYSIDKKANIEIERILNRKD